MVARRHTLPSGSHVESVSEPPGAVQSGPASPSAGAQGSEVGPWVWSPEGHSRGGSRALSSGVTSGTPSQGGLIKMGAEAQNQMGLDFGEFTHLGFLVSQRHPGPKTSCSFDLRLQLPERQVTPRACECPHAGPSFPPAWESDHTREFVAPLRPPPHLGLLVLSMAPDEPGVPGQSQTNTQGWRGRDGDTHLQVGLPAGHLGKTQRDQNKGQAAKQLAHTFRHPRRRVRKSYVHSAMNSHPPRSHFRIAPASQRAC